MNNNFMLIHSMDGTDLKYAKCTCGHEGHLHEFDAVYSCPDCNTTKILSLESLYFGKRAFSLLLVQGKDRVPGEIYNFQIDVYFYTGNTKINFSKKSFKIEDLKEQHFRYVFDKNQSKKDMIKIYDITGDKELSVAEGEKIRELIDNNRKTHKNLRDIDSISANAFRFSSYSSAYEILYYMHDRLTKCRRYCTTYEQLVKSNIDVYDIYNLSGIVDLTKTTPSQQLSLNPAVFKLVKDISPDDISSVQAISRIFGKHTINYFEVFGCTKFSLNEYNAQKIYNLNTEANISLKKLYKYIFKEVPRKQALYDSNNVLQLLYDSYYLAKDLDLEFDKAPQTLQRYHNVLTREHKLVEDKIKNQKFKLAVKEYKPYEVMSEEIIAKKKEEYEKEGKELSEKQIRDMSYNMVLPKDIQDLVAEGKSMNHCVGGYTNRILRNESLILFLREASNPNKSYATIEVRPTTKTIIQVKANSNRKLENPSAVRFIQNWCKENDIKWNTNTW